MASKKKIVRVLDIVPTRSSKKSIVTRRLDDDDSDAFASDDIDILSRVEPETKLKKARMHAAEDVMQAIRSRATSRDGDMNLARDFGDDDFKKPLNKKMVWSVFGGTVLVVACLLYLGFAVLPRVAITVTAKKGAWEFHDALTVNKNISTVDSASSQIPGQIIPFPTTGTKNVVASFVPTGNAYHEEKARGTMTIVNTGNTAVQKLVATTRFQAPDGKIVRLVDAVTVPAITDAKKSATVDVEVVADKAGPEYNIGPIEKLTIPGFDGSPKADMYYGKITKALSGGMIGNGAYPTNEDIAKAKTQAAGMLQDVLKSMAGSDMPQGMMFVDGGVTTTIKKQTVNTTLDDKGQFSVYAEGSLTVFAFQEDAVKNLLLSRAQAQLDKPEAYDQNMVELTYKAATVDWKKGTMSLPMDYKTSFIYHIDQDALRNAVATKGETDLKTVALSTPGVEKITVSFWPFWVRSAPSRVTKITTAVE